MNPAKNPLAAGEPRPAIDPPRFAQPPLQKLAEALVHCFRSLPADIPTERLQRVEVPIEPINIIDWLLEQPHPQKIYWSDPAAGSNTTGTDSLVQPVNGAGDALQLAGVGVADMLLTKGDFSEDRVFSVLRRRMAGGHPRAKYFGGMRFRPDLTPHDLWHSFGRCRFWVPRLEISSDGRQTCLACNFLLQEPSRRAEQLKALIGEISRLNWRTAQGDKHIPDQMARTDLPERTEWDAMIRRALALFDSGALTKVVLARQTHFEFREALDALRLLRKLQRAHGGLTHFYFQPDAAVAFIGGTPETLYHRRGGRISSEAIAGTRPRGGTPQEDRRLRRELRKSAKEVQEHRIVVDSIAEAFATVCRKVEKPGKPSVLKLATLQHLYAGIAGDLNPGCADAEILRALHPTPAVGGVPRAAALAEISRMERFDRGWYSGPVGWIGPQAANFVVAIRSGLVCGRDLYLYSGAGIVPGSLPAAEWDEIESKIFSFMNALS